MLRSLAERLVGLTPLRYQRTARQFIKFLITGTAGAIVDFTSYNILTRVVGWDTVFEPFGYKIIAANLCSVFLAISCNFLLNKYWTFKNSEGAVLKQWSGYFALNTLTFVLNQLITSFFTFHVPIVALVFGSQRDNAAKAIAIGCILFVNFLGSKFVVFRPHYSSPAAPEAPL
jgi:putative flippase GtrA